jgi:hypothetical protein
MGRTTLASGGADGLTVFEVACGDGAITLAEAQALSDSIVANDGKVLGVPGKTAHRWRLGENGAVPLAVTDQVGALGVSRQGTLAAGAQYARSFPF